MEIGQIAVAHVVGEDEDDVGFLPSAGGGMRPTGRRGQERSGGHGLQQIPSTEFCHIVSHQFLR